jgi:nucleotide-binding universal stress UspA family protein
MTLTNVLQPRRQVAQPQLSTMVVATDFSNNATAALDWAIDLAKAHSAKIVLVHAVEMELPALAEAMGPIDTDVRQKLETVSKRLTDGHVLAQTEYDLGRPWSVIAAIATKATADLIVVGAHGKSKFRVLGTVADRLIRTTSIPVLVHRARADGALGVRTVLAASDFSDEAARATQTAVSLLGNSTRRARLVLFHAVPLMNIHDLNMAASMSTYWDDTERAAAQRLETLAAAWRSDRLQVEVKTVRGYPSEAILHEAEVTQADLIALGTVGRSGLNQFFMGSVAQRVLHQAKCPVLVVRKPEPGEQSDPSIQPQS